MSKLSFKSGLKPPKNYADQFHNQRAGWFLLEYIAMRKLLITISFLSILAFAACQESELSTNEREVNFCYLFDIPGENEAKIIETKAIALGFHEFIFYSGQCLENNKIAALEMNSESRRKIIEAIQANKITYKTDFLNNTLYAEVTVSGELKKNDEKWQTDDFRPSYKFVVQKVKDVKILSEEIFPSDEARGVKEIK